MQDIRKKATKPYESRQRRLKGERGLDAVHASSQIQAWLNIKLVCKPYWNLVTIYHKVSLEKSGRDLAFFGKQNDVVC